VRQVLAKVRRQKQKSSTSDKTQHKQLSKAIAIK